MHFRRAQGSTEYLILLGVVMLVAIAAVGLMNLIPSTSTDVRITQSDTYWKGQAKPFTILQHRLGGNGTLDLVLTNNLNERVRLENVSVGGDGYSGSYEGPQVINAHKSVLLTMDLGKSSQEKQTYELSVNITYGPVNSGLRQIQFGAVPLVGRISDSQTREILDVRGGEGSGTDAGGSGGGADTGGGIGSGTGGTGGSGGSGGGNSGLGPIGAPCQTLSECLSGHCWGTGGGKVCVECEGNGHCPQGLKCVANICQ